MATVNKRTLESGLHVVTLPMRHMASVSIGVWIRGGVRDETRASNGITHLLEHLLFKGTPKRSGERLKQEIEGRGGSFNGFTAEEFTCYLVKVLAKDTGLGIDVLADMVLHPLLKESDIEKEKRVVIEEINMYKDMPSHYIHELLTEKLWPDHPLGFPLAGSPESVHSITRGDVVGYRSRYYDPSNLVVLAVGDLDSAAVERFCRRSFGKGNESAAPLPQRAARKVQDKAETVFFEKKTEQTHLAMGIHAIDRFHPDRYTLSLLNVILGANMSSRLFQEVRERRALCYEIGSSIRRYADAGAFIVSAGVDVAKLPKAVDVICAEFEKVKRRPVPAGELKRAKEFYKGQLQLMLEETMSSMLWYGEKIISREPDHDVSSILKRVDAIDQDELMRVARQLFIDTNLNLAVIGPVKDRRPVEKALHIG